MLKLVDDVFSLMNTNELALSFSHIQHGVISILKEHYHFGVFIVYFLHFDKTQMYEPLKATKHHNSLELSILLPVRANLLCILQCETHCNS